MTDALRFDRVQRHFGRRLVLDGITFTLPAAEKALLTGPNGAGKTTLLRLAATLLRPTGGTLSIGGHPAHGDAARRQLAYVPQTAAVYEELTPMEQVTWWARLHGHPADARTALVDAGLERHLRDPARVLSRGQRQRLALTCAWATRAPLLLLDEPTSSLDEAGRDWLTGLLEAHAGSALIASHHGLPADRRLHLEGGRLA